LNESGKISKLIYLHSEITSPKNGKNR